jgi:hypothetical protein
MESVEKLPTGLTRLVFSGAKNMNNKIPKETTHTDCYGNFYKCLGEFPKEFCVFYWSPSSKQWFQDLGKDFSHLIKIKA